MVSTQGLSGLLVTGNAVAQGVAAGSTQMRPDGLAIQPVFTSREGFTRFDGVIPNQVSEYAKNFERTTTMDAGKKDAASDVFQNIAPNIANNKGNTLAEMMKNTVGALDGATKGVQSNLTVMSNLQSWVGKMNENANLIQQTRENLEQTMAGKVSEVNNILDRLKDINDTLGTMGTQSRHTPDHINLISEQTDQIDKLLKLINIQMNKNTDTGAIYLTIGNNTDLLDESKAHHLSFAPTRQSDGSMTYANGGLNAVKVDGTDITPFIKAGELSGLIQMRDEALPAWANRLDALSLAFQSNVNQIFNSGSPYPPLTSFRGVYSYNPTDEITVSGDITVTILDANGVLIDSHTIGSVASIPSTSTSIRTVQDLIDELNTALGDHMTVSLTSEGKLVMAGKPGKHLAIGGEGTVELDAAAETRTNLSHFFGFQNVFESLFDGLPPTLIRTHSSCTGSATYQASTTITTDGPVFISIFDQARNLVESIQLGEGDITIADLLEGINGPSQGHISASLTSNGNLQLEANGPYSFTFGGHGTLSTGTGTPVSIQDFFGIDPPPAPANHASQLRIATRFSNNPALLATSSVNTTVTVGESVVASGDKSILENMRTFLSEYGDRISIDGKNDTFAGHLVSFLGDMVQMGKKYVGDAAQASKQLDVLRESFLNETRVDLEKLFSSIKDLIMLREAVLATIKKIQDSAERCMQIIAS